MGAPHPDALTRVLAAPPADDPERDLAMTDQPSKHVARPSAQPNVFGPSLKRRERTVKVEEQRQVLRGLQARVDPGPVLEQMAWPARGRRFQSGLSQLWMKGRPGLRLPRRAGRARWRDDGLWRIQPDLGEVRDQVASPAVDVVFFDHLLQALHPGG